MAQIVGPATRAWREGLHAPTVSEADPEQVKAWTEALSKTQERIAASRQQAMEASTARFKARGDTLSALSKALADYSMASAVGSQAKAKGMELQQKLAALSAEQYLYVGDPKLLGEFNKGVDAAVTSMVNARQVDDTARAFRHLQAKGWVTPDGDFTQDGLDYLGQRASSGVAKTVTDNIGRDYAAASTDPKRVFTAQNEAATAGAAVAAAVAPSDIRELLSLANGGQPVEDERVAAYRDAVSARAAEYVVSGAREVVGADAWEHALASRQLSEQALRGIDAEIQSLGANATGRGDIKQLVGALAADLDSDSPTDMASLMRDIAVPDDLIAERDFYHEKLGEQGRVTESPWTRAQREFMATPGAKELFEAGGFRNVDAFAEWAAGSPEEAQKALKFYRDAMAGELPDWAVIQEGLGDPSAWSPEDWAMAFEATGVKGLTVGERIGQYVATAIGGEGWRELPPAGRAERGVADPGERLAEAEAKGERLGDSPAQRKAQRDAQAEADAKVEKDRAPGGVASRPNATVDGAPAAPSTPAPPVATPTAAPAGLLPSGGTAGEVAGATKGWAPQLPGVPLDPRDDIPFGKDAERSPYSKPRALGPKKLPSDYQ